ncbi:hypothetical protein TSUD_325020 [Trifolium subterraneum]|uniref:Uncharacterized protein n=1 Tax=Trifolium subterraneum TaxID=3900 RepID=A0A2Z6P9T6_TRISU|nr:hypothetical protein TSUD_325020 [Trifolium subterraneum]
MQEFHILRVFFVQVHPPKTPVIKEVYLHPTKAYWIKCNVEDVALGCLGVAACGGIFRDSFVATLGCFARHIGISFVFHA